MNYETRYEEVWESGDIAPHIFNLPLDGGFFLWGGTYAPVRSLLQVP
jgi:hypothetical protein